MRTGSKLIVVNAGEDFTRAVEPYGQTPSDPGYMYHATHNYNAADIASDRLRPHRPWHGTDQATWPDGSTEKRSYWVATAAHAHSFVPEGGRGVLLRARMENHDFKKESTGDYYLTKSIHPNKVEIHTEGGWVPIKKWAGLS